MYYLLEVNVHIFMIFSCVIPISTPSGDCYYISDIQNTDNILTDGLNDISLKGGVKIKLYFWVVPTTKWPNAAPKPPDI